jgi:Orsellinic acid/F9775 biosynthesis cluster protein D
MIALRQSPNDPIQCPVPGCHGDMTDLRQLSEHTKDVHTSQEAILPPEDVAQILVPDTPPIPPAPLPKAVQSPSVQAVSTPGDLVPTSPPHTLQSPDHHDMLQSYLESNELFYLMGIRYHCHYKVLICTCGQAVLDSGCVKHVYGHGIKLTKHQQSQYDDIIKGLALIKKMKDVVTPPPGGPPVELLLSHPDGYCCNVCPYCAPQKRTIDNHWYATHSKDDDAGRSDRHHRGTIQTFFHPVGQQYFEVNPGLSGLSADDMFTVYIRDEVPKYPPFPASCATNPRDVPLLLQVTQWHEHLGAYIPDPNQRAALLSLVNLPHRHTPAGLGRLGNIVFEYLKMTRMQANRMSIDMRRLLIECPR